MSKLRLILAVVGALLLAPGPAVARSRANDLELRCGAAVAYVREVLARDPGSRVLFNAEPFGAMDLLESGWWIEGADPPVRAVPPADLIARDHERRRSAVSACPSLRQFLDARAIAYGQEAVEAASTASGRLRDDVSLLDISLPLLSEDGRRALLTFSHSGAGASRLLLARQRDGRWRKIAHQPLALY